MNNATRKKIQAIIASLEDMQSRVEEISDEEGEKRDNMEENFGNTDRFADIEAACDALGSALDSFEDLISNLEDAMV